MLTDVKTRKRNEWSPFITVGIAGACVVLLFWPTVDSIIQTWLVSETFTHGFFVIPVFLWLVWRKRATLSFLPANPDLTPIVFISGSGALWLLSKLAGIQVGEQLAFALVLVFTLWAALGRHIARELTFPLLFLLFLAPVGEELVPALMELTADLTVWAIRNTGIPIYREGLFFTLPSGHWSVVEACSGIRYLIASSVLGSLYAYLSYSSIKLRFVFFAISLIIPILANSIRAYLIVMLGHFSGNKLATGVDHLVYGWLFFGVVMFALFSAGGWLQRFDTKKDISITKSDSLVSDDSNNETAVTQPHPTTGSLWPRVIAMLVIHAVAAAGPVWSTAIAANSSLNVTANTNLPLLFKDQTVAPVPDMTEPTRERWQPHNSGHDLKVEAVYEEEDLPPVRALAFLYRQQRQGKEMINSGNVIARSQNDIWRLIQALPRTLVAESDSSFSVREYRIRAGDQRRIVWQWYRIGDDVTANPLLAKLLEVKNQLLLRHSPSVNYMLVVDSTLDEYESALQSALSSAIAR